MGRILQSKESEMKEGDQVGYELKADSTHKNYDLKQILRLIAEQIQQTAKTN